MKKFQELIIRHPEAALVSLLDRMKESRNRVFEYRSMITLGYAKSAFIDVSHAGLFKASRKTLFESMVWVMIEGNRLRVMNIVPSTKSSLGIEEYNKVLLSFFHDFVSIFLDDSWTDSVHITGEIIDVSNQMTPRCYEALRSWEMNCNKSAPISHPHDEARWFLFVSYLHKDKDQCQFDISDFAKWLSEDMRWPSGYSEQIYEMEVNLEYTLSMLEYYDRVQD